ncbi:MAG TPA: hypothetical protein VFY42_05750 [Gemmatimonadales bacterium]|nr:hypothetical protein [Gemmatimonadales bacterium]
MRPTMAAIESLTGPEPVQAGLSERILSPLTLASDLGKRWSAQRLALDT